MAFPIENPIVQPIPAYKKVLRFTVDEDAGELQVRISTYTSEGVKIDGLCEDYTWSLVKDGKLRFTPDLRQSIKEAIYAIGMDEGVIPRSAT